MNRQQKYPEMNQDKRQLRKWIGRVTKNFILRRKYTFTPDDFTDLAMGIRYGNWMASRFYKTKLYQAMMNKTFGPIDNPKAQSRVIPLNAKVSKNKNAVVPYELVDNFIDSAGFIMILDYCLCRKGMECKEYPRDFGCIMLGEGARAMLEQNQGRELTAEEAKTLARKATELGLVTVAAQAKIEEQVMAIPKDKRHQFIELCFCCPCCCVAIKNLKYHTPLFLKHNVVNVAYAAKALPDCKGCNKCVDVCTAGAIRINGNKVWVKEDDCIGCGLCVYKCKHDAIQLVQIGKNKGDKLIDYFDNIHLDLS